MLQAHLPLLITLVVAVVLGAVILGLGVLLGPRRASRIKEEAFECGNPPTGDARERFNVKYYMVAILFLVFDIEAVFVYPWAVTFSDSTKGKSALSPVFALVEMLVFVAIILVGLAYAWRKGALEWGNAPRFQARSDAASGHH